MASDLVFSNIGKIDRLSLLDPGGWVRIFEKSTKVPKQYRMGGKQYGMVNRVRLWKKSWLPKANNLKSHFGSITELCQFCGYIPLINSGNLEDQSWPLRCLA